MQDELSNSYAAQRGHNKLQGVWAPSVPCAACPLALNLLSHVYLMPSSSDFINTRSSPASNVASQKNRFEQQRSDATGEACIASAAQCHLQ